MTKPVLITGAAGRMGSVLVDTLAENHVLRLADIALPSDAQYGAEWISCDITNVEDVTRAMIGIDCVVHLAGTPNSKEWDEIASLNIDGTRNVFDAALEAGVSKIIYASSSHTMGMYPLENRFTDNMPFRADSLYGISKAFGEVYLRYLCEKHGLTGYALRVGRFRQAPDNARSLYTWISPGDLVRLMESCLKSEADGYHVLYGISANNRLDIESENGVAVDYQPEDCAADYADPILLKSNQLPCKHLGGDWAEDAER